MRPTRTTLCKLLFLFLFFSVNQFVSGQTVAEKTMVLHGTVMDSVKKVPIDYATVILQDSSGKGLKSSLTNGLGAFEFSNLQRGRYIIQVMNVGYRNKSFPVLLNSNSSDPASGDSNSAEQMIVDTIYLAPDPIGLKEVSIAGRRPMIKQDIDGITYDLQADPESKVKNVLDMMRKIPMIDVDAEDNIKLKGNSNFRILINGKPSSMMARSPKDALKAMSASNILKIEVLTTPPAKYDGEGLAGIINIITNKKIDNGYNGNVNSYYRFPVGGLTTSGSIGVKSGKFGLNVFGGISENISPNSLRLNSRSTTGDFPTSLAQDRINNFDSQYHAFSSSLSFEVDTLNLISADFAYNDGLYKSFNVQNTTLSDAQGSTLESYRVNNVLRNPFYGLDLGLNYELGFKKKKNKLLTLSYKYTTSSDDTDYRLNIEERYQYDNPSFIQVNNGRSAEQTVQLDYYNAFKKLTIEGGIKGIFRNNRSDFQYGTLNDITSTYDFQAATRNAFTNEQNVYSIYNSYQYSLDRLTVKAGLRLEETTTTSDTKGSSIAVNDRYQNLIPSISLNWKFDKQQQSFNLGYSRRIQRPNIWNLNPFVDRSNPSFEIAGNPSLRPVKSNNILLNYSNLKKVSVNVGVTYAFANNTIQQISVYDQSSRVTRTTFDNIGKDRLVGTDFNVNYPIASMLTLGAGGNLGYLWLEGVVDGTLVRSKGLKGNAFGRAALTIKPGFHVNADVKYQSADITLQGRFRPNVYTSFSMDKDLVARKLTLSGNVSNPFSKYRSFELVSTGNDFRQVSTNINYFRSFTFSLNYKFGKTYDAIKQSKRKIVNDDATGGKLSN